MNDLTIEEVERLLKRLYYSAHDVETGELLDAGAFASISIEDALQAMSALTNAADTISAQAAEIERLKEYAEEMRIICQRLSKQVEKLDPRAPKPESAARDRTASQEQSDD